MKIKIVPWITVSPNTAFSSFSKKKIIFENLLEYWELANQYIWGMKNAPIKIENQFNINE